MYILCNNFDNNYLKTLLNTIQQKCYCVIKFTHTNEEFQRELKQNKYNLVLVCFDNYSNTILLKNTILNNPQNKYLLISNLFICNLVFDCTQCIELYNMKRILLPVDALSLVKTILSFNKTECTYQYKFNMKESFLEIIPDILQRFDKITYEDTTKTITINKNTCSYSTLLEIMNMLDYYRINYEIINKNTIKIIDENDK